MARKFGNLSAQDAIQQTPYKSGTAIEGGFRSALAQLEAGKLASAITKAQQREPQLYGNYVDNPFGGTEEVAAPTPNSYVQMLEAERQRQQAFAAGVAPRVQRLEDIRGLGDAANYVGGVVGATPVTMAPVIGAAVAGRVGGKLLAPVAGRVSPALASALPAAGSGAAAYATSYDMLADENLNAQLNDPNASARSADDRLRNARLAAMGGAVLDAALPVGLAGAARKLGMSGGNAAVGALAGAGVEGATEAAQLGLQNLQLRNLGGTTMQDSGLDYLNAGVAGAIGGGAMSGAAAGVGYAANKFAKPVAPVEQALTQELDAVQQPVVEAQPQKTMADAEWKAEWEKAQPGYADSQPQEIVPDAEWKAEWEKAQPGFSNPTQDTVDPQESQAVVEANPTVVADEAAQILTGAVEPDAESLASDPIGYEQEQSAREQLAAQTMLAELKNGSLKSGTTPSIRARVKQLDTAEQLDDASVAEIVSLYNQTVQPTKLADTVQRLKEGGTVAASGVKGDEKHSFADAKLSRNTAPLRREIEVELISSGLVNDPKQAREVAKNIMLLDTLSAQSDKEIDAVQYAAMIEGREVIKKFDQNGKITKTLAAARELEAQRVAEGKQPAASGIASVVRDTESASDPDLFNRFTALTDMDSKLNEGRWEESVMMQIMPAEARSRMLGINDSAPDNVKLDGVARPILHIATQIDIANDPAVSEAQREEAQGKLLSFYKDKPRVDLVLNAYKDLRSAATKTDPRQLDEERSILAEEMAGNTTVAPLNNEDYTLPDDREGETDGTWMDNEKLDAQKDLRPVEYMGTGKHNAPFPSSAATRETAEDREWVGLADHLERSAPDLDHKQALGDAIKSVRSEVNQVIGDRVKSEWNTGAIKQIRSELGLTGGHAEGDNLAQVSNALRTKYSAVRADLNEVQRLKEAADAAKADDEVSPAMKDLAVQEYRTARAEAINTHGEQMVRDTLAGQVRFSDKRFSAELGKSLDDFTNYPSWVFDDETAATIAEADPDTVRSSLNELKVNAAKNEDGGLNFTRQEVLKLAEARDVDGNTDTQEQRGHRLFKVKDDNGKVHTFDTSRVANAMLKKLQQNGSYTTKGMSWTQKTVDALIQGLGSIKLAPGFGKAFSGKDADVARRIAQLSLARLNPNFFPEVHDLKVGDVAKTFGMSPALYKQTRAQLEEDILMGKFPTLDAKAFDKELNKRMVAASRMGAEEGAGIIRVPGEESVAGKVDRQAIRARAEKMGVVEEDVVIEPDALDQPVKSQEEQLLEEERKEQREIASGKKPNRDLTGAPITYTDKALPYYRAVVDPTARFEYRPTVEEAAKTLEAKSEKKTTVRKPAINARQKAFIEQTNEGSLTGQVIEDPVSLVENLVDVFTQLAQNGHLDGTRTSAAKKAAHVWVEVLDPKSAFHIGRRALAAGVITTTQYEAILEKTGHAVDKHEGHTFVGKSTPGFADDFKKAMKMMSKDKTMSEQELFEQTGWFRDARGEWRKDINTVGEYTSLGANLMQMEMNGETTRNLGKMLNGQGAGRALRTHMDKVTVSMPSTWSLETPNTFDEAAGVIHVNPVRQILHVARRDQMFKLGDKVISYRELKLLFGKENAKGELALASKDEVSKRFAEKFPDVDGALETALNDAAAASALEGVQRIVQQLSYAEQQTNNWTGAAIDYLGGDKKAQKLAAKIADPSATLEERGAARLALLEQVAQTVGATIYNEDGSVNTEKRDFIADIIAQQMAKDPREREIRNMLDSRFGTTYPQGSKLADMEAALTDEQRAVRDQMTAELTRMIGTRISQQFDILEGDSEHGRGAFVEYRALDGSSVLKVLRFAAATQSGDIHVARHESVHAFFSMLKGRAKQQVWRDLRRAILESSRVRSEVLNHYKDQKAVLDQLDPRKNPDYEEEMMAYAFQLYVDGKLNLNPKSRNFFNKVVAFVANVLGLATQEQRAAALFDALFAGELNPSDPEKGGYGGRNIANKMRELNKRGRPTETFRNKLERTAPGVARMADTLFATPTEVLRNSGSKALTELAEMFAPHMASARNGGLIANRGQRAAQFHNRWARLVGKFEKAELSKALADAQAMREPTTAAGREVRKFLSDMYQYSTEAGVQRWDPKLRQYKDIVEMQNYFPRVWEHGYISQHEDEFKALIKKYSKMSEDDVDALLREIAENDGRIEILTEKVGLDAGFTPFQSSISQRGFTFIDEANAHEFAKFQSQDMNDIMAGYIEQAVHRAEYTRLFGNRGEVIDKFIQRAAVEDGISPEEIIQTYRYHIDALSGTLGSHSMGRGLRLAQATAITAQNIILLPFAIFSQVIDGLGSSVRTGNIRDAKNAYGQVLKDMTRFAFRDKSYDYAQDVAEMLGVVSQEAAVHAVNNAGMFMMNKGLRNVNRHFFRWNGMSGWNDSMRKAAMITGIQFLEQHTGLKGGKVDERRFEELGLTLEEAKDMVVRFREGEKRGVAPQFSTTQAQAMYRFVDQAVIRPNASMRASWLSDPRWMIFAHLKQFTYGMHKVTIARAMHEADNDQMASLAILAGYAPMALAADMTKWALLGMNVTEGWDAWDYMRHAVTRGGLLGLWEFGANVAGDAGSGRIPGSSLVGPTVEHGMTVARSLNIGVDKPVDWDRIADRSLPGYKYMTSD